MIKKLVLGTVQFGLNYGVNNTRGLPSEIEVNEILALAQSRGIYRLDTATAYGLAEERIGAYHRVTGVKQRFEVNTKLRKETHLNWQESLRNSISATCVDKINTIMFHSFESYLAQKAHIPSYKEAGAGRLFDKIGVSVYTNDEIDLLLNDEFISVVQFPYNLLDNNGKRGDVIQKLKDKGKEIHTRSCFLQGLFFMKEDAVPPNLSELKPYMKKITQVANANNIEVGHLALQYCLQNNLINGVLVGVETTEQLQKNINWASDSLDASILKYVDTLAVSNIDLLNPSKW